MELYTRITLFVDRLALIPPHSTIIVGLSGGSDSIFLLHYLYFLHTERPFTIIAAHMNHEWRAEADHDEQFCKETAYRLGIPYIAGRATEYLPHIGNSSSREEQGRLMRRAFFSTLIEQYGPTTRIALAHHQDDQDETFFIRLVRGAGIQGLKGMNALALPYIRPLLCVRKQELLKYLDEHSIGYVIDSTNHDDAYLRNRIRHRVLPALRQCDHRFSHSLHQALNHLAEADEFLTQLAEETLQKMTISTQGLHWIDIVKLSELHPFLQKQIILLWLKKSDISFTPSQGFLNEILRFLFQQTGGKHTLAPSWYIQKQHNRATILTH